MDDPISCVDPTGLWSKENFDESKVSRDGQGQFSSTPGGTGGGSSLNGANKVTAPQSDSGWLVADAGTTATDGSSHWSPPSKAQEHELIGRAFGENALGLYKEIQALE